MEKPLLCIVHIPKTAGTTIRETFCSILGREKIYWVGHDQPIAHWESAAGSDFDDYLVVGGHVSARAFEKIQRPRAYLALVREPIRRAVSLFDFITKGPDMSHPLRDELKGVTLIEAVEKSSRFRIEVANRQCTLIGGAPRYSEALKSISEKIWFIDRQERLEDLMRRVCKVFEWSFNSLVTANVNKRIRYFENYSSSEIVAILKEINRQDTFLYESLAPEPTDDRGPVQRSTGKMALAEGVFITSDRSSAGSKVPVHVPASIDQDPHGLGDSLSFSIDEFVTSAYKAVLGRHPDPTGLRDHGRVLRTLPAPQGIERVVRALLNSKEFEKRRADAQRVPPEIAVFTPGQARWFSTSSTPGNHIVIARFRVKPNSRPTIYVTHPTLLNTERVACSVDYVDQIISKFLLCESVFDMHLGANAFLDEDEELCGVFQVHDHTENIPNSIGYCANKPDITLIPDPDFWASGGYFNERREFKQKWVPWEDRNRSIFWRGSSTSSVPTITLATFENLPRFRLCAARKKSKTLRSVLDAKLTNIVRPSSGDEAEKIRAYVEREGLWASRVPQIDFLNHRFQIDIDGNSNSWSFFVKLLMGSCVLKVVSNWRQWYCDYLRPWQHYVPIQNDLADLEERVEWCLGNDEGAREIAENGRKFANQTRFGVEIPRAAAAVLKASRTYARLLS
jgi:hypothetical protein